MALEPESPFDPLGTAPKSADVSIPEAARLIGCCKRILLTEFIRRGLLPYPDPKTLTWPRATVEALVARFEAERKARGAKR